MTSRISQAYYDSADATEFYRRVWGGEDIHIGVYASPNDTVAVASRRSLARAASRLAHLPPGSSVLDLGAGIGGTARYLASNHRWRITALNISGVQNAEHAGRNADAGLDNEIAIIGGSFEGLPFPPRTFDAACSFDSLLHSADPGKVLAEVVTVLRPGGDFVFTDPMKALTCPPEVLKPILERLDLSDLSSMARYHELAAEAGLVAVDYRDQTPDLVRHYERILEGIDDDHDLARHVSAVYLVRARTGLQHWIDGGRNGHLQWGMFHFRKPAN